MVIVKNRQMLFSNREQYIGTSYDNNSTNLSFRLDRINEDGYDLAGLVFKIDIKYSDTDTEDTVNVDVDVNDDYVYLTWQITNTVLQHEGTHIIQVRGYEESGTFKWSTYKNVIYIEDALEDVPESAATLTAMEQYKVKIDAKIDKDAAAETARETAETARATAETARETAETERATAESTRASEFATLKSGYDTASKLARSYAVGGTGTRTGEDTDNAKYYKEQAQAISVGSLHYESEKIHFGDTDSTTSGGETSSIVAENTNRVYKVYTFKDSTARSEASSAQSTANTAVSNAAAAQNTANTAVSNAAAAQSTANTAVSNAATAQSTANTAVSNAATAQSAAESAQTTANAALPKSYVVQTNQNDANTVPSSALLYSVSADKDNKLYTSAFWNYFSWKYISPLNVVPTALNTAYSYQNDLLKNKPFVVVSFAGVSACIFCANTNKECSYSDYNPDNPYWRQIITAGYNPSTGTVWAKVRYKGSSQSFASLAITDVQYFG